MASTKDFFKEKKEWSKFKDDLLNNYLKPYLEKIKLFNRDICIFDCFAGKGKFDDGSEGSPLIILRNIMDSNAADLTHAVFIESKYTDDLKKNLLRYKDHCTVFQNTYESTITNLKNMCSNKNVFLYIDPYGIKSLDFKYFTGIKETNPKTMELLLNFNTTGFLREGCRLLNFPYKNGEISLEVEYEEDDNNSVENMNLVAKGDYWKDILFDYYSKAITFWEAEVRFAKEYCYKLENVFKYVINVPINEKSTTLPKYRMIFGTNHHAGLILMVDQMNKVWRDILDNTSCGQIGLFEEIAESSINDRIQVFNFINIEEAINSKFVSSPQIDMLHLYIDIIKKSGITYSKSVFCREIARLEANNRIRIIWDCTSGRNKSKALSNFDKTNHKIIITGV